ncbi:MAG: D-Ala-D-Ala carboxypeptidase family metallohydrolase [Bosea sp. (in: a-proteobacteria)]
MMSGRSGVLKCLVLLWLPGMCLWQPTPALAQSDAAPKATAAPFPPPRPFDLYVPPASSSRVAPSAPAVPPPSAAQPASTDSPPRAVSSAPAPPRRPEIAPLSRAEDEEDEPAQEWPRRTPAQKDIPFEPRITPSDDVIANGVSTDPGTSTRCLPASLQRVLQSLVKQYGSVRVTSTFRPAWRARRNSFHRRCQAMDLRVPGQSPRSVLQYVKTLTETGGHKVYWNGIVHVDTGPWRSW